MNAIERIKTTGLVPVVVIEDAGKAVDTANALLAGGIDVMEITLRTEAGLKAIEQVAKNCPDMLVGAGTVLSVEAAQKSKEAGAQFLVSPGLNHEVVKWACNNDITITPGCVTPGEIEAAMSYGLKTVKFFPADVYGGINALKALNGPYESAGINFIPTGGVNNDNLADYADKPYVAAIGGGWLCKPADINAGNYSGITENAKKAVEILLGFNFAHLGINEQSKENALDISEGFGRLFGFAVKVGNSSTFASSAIEITHGVGLGKNGHIAVKTNSIHRAIAYLERQGITFDKSSAKYNNGRLIAIYLEKEIGGFAIHLLTSQL